VRGITLKREELPLPDWIRDLVAEVTRAASVGEKARTVLESLVR
jgi:hypothetical protein